jgi:large subunit ribosomal protein L16
MLLVPLKQKYKKSQKGKAFNKIKSNKLLFKCGQIGLKSLSAQRVSSKQLITLYNHLRKQFKKRGKVFLRVFPQKSITKKPTEVRMGKGKGSFHSWVVCLSPGIVLCEISTPYIRFAKKVLHSLRPKLSFKTTIIYRSL